MNITGEFPVASEVNNYVGAFYKIRQTSNNGRNAQPNYVIGFDASRSWSGSTSSATPYTTNMGSGTPLTVNPEHITVKAWKRLS